MTTDQLEKPKQQEAPTPDPALKRLDRLVGTWKMEGRPLGSDDYSIKGKTRFGWLHDAQGKSFFLQQDMEMDYDGKPIKSHELIGYNPKTKAFSSFVYSNMAPDPWPYDWDIDGDDITISIKKPPMDATFKGKLADDGKSFSGGWRPNPGADETVVLRRDSHPRGLIGRGTCRTSATVRRPVPHARRLHPAPAEMDPGRAGH